MKTMTLDRISEPPVRPAWWKKDWSYEGPGGFKEYWDNLPPEEQEEKREELMDYMMHLMGHILLEKGVINGNPPL